MFVKFNCRIGWWRSFIPEGKLLTILQNAWKRLRYIQELLPPLKPPMLLGSYFWTSFFMVCSLSSSNVNVGYMENFRCDLRILSDANQFFIEKILEHHDLLGCFSKIYTNPTFVDEQGRLRIFPYHDSTLSPHGCSLCPSNLCKVNKFTDWAYLSKIH